MAETTWTLTRTGERVRVDLQNASGITPTDTVAISEALEEYLSDDQITVVQVDGPVLMESEMPPGLGSAMRELGDLARSEASDSTSARSEGRGSGRRASQIHTPGRWPDLHS